MEAKVKEQNTKQIIYTMHIYIYLKKRNERHLIL